MVLLCFIHVCMYSHEVGSDHTECTMYRCVNNGTCGLTDANINCQVQACIIMHPSATNVVMEMAVP